eukprot:14739654-Alexandrium_andersonii.AAC.1
MCIRDRGDGGRVGLPDELASYHEVAQSRAHAMLARCMGCEPRDIPCVDGMPLTLYQPGFE